MRYYRQSRQKVETKQGRRDGASRDDIGSYYSSSSSLGRLFTRVGLENHRPHVDPVCRRLGTRYLSIQAIDQLPHTDNYIENTIHQLQFACYPCLKTGLKESICTTTGKSHCQTSPIGHKATTMFTRSLAISAFILAPMLMVCHARVNIVGGITLTLLCSRRR
jgi:hypothetical protein